MLISDMRLKYPGPTFPTDVQLKKLKVDETRICDLRLRCTCLRSACSLPQLHAPLPTPISASCGQRSGVVRFVSVVIKEA